MRPCADERRAMMVSRSPRSPLLARFVQTLWLCQSELAHRYERVLPSAQMQLLVNLDEDRLGVDEDRLSAADGRVVHRTGGVALQGVRSAPVLIDTAHQRDACGVSFRAGGAWPFLAGTPAFELRDQLVDLSLVWGASGRRLRERLLETRDAHARLDVLEAALLQRLGGMRDARSPVDAACRMLEQGASVRSAGEQLALGPRRMIDAFRERVGVSPKLFARLARFQRTLRAVRGEASGAQVAAALGFSDQAHMIREFRTFARTTPSQHRPRSADAPNHVAWAEESLIARA